MRKRGRFLKETITHFRQIGALGSSSPLLVRTLLSDVDFSSAKIIAEFGAGDGCVTRELLRRMRPDAHLVSFELSEVFYEEIASIHDARLTPVLGCASHAVEFLEENSVDCIISGLPLGNFDRAKKEQILDSVSALLKPGGRFCQFQYSLLDYGLMRRRFDDVKLHFTALNFPPAFVYCCVKM